MSTLSRTQNINRATDKPPGRQFTETNRKGSSPCRATNEASHLGVPDSTYSTTSVDSKLIRTPGTSPNQSGHQHKSQNIQNSLKYLKIHYLTISPFIFHFLQFSNIFQYFSTFTIFTKNLLIL